MKNFFKTILVISSFFIAKNAFSLEYRDIPSEYFLEIDLKQRECEKLTNVECYGRDSMSQSPYYHKVKLRIFENQIFAERFFKNSEFKTDREFVKIKDGTFTLTTNKRNLISFTSKGGKVTSLKILNGIMANETKNPSECKLSEFKYGFYKNYDKEKLLSKSVNFKNDENFIGIEEMIIFKDKDSYKTRALLNLSPQSQNSVKTINLCQMPKGGKNSEEFLQREISRRDCILGKGNNLQQCLKYKDCRDYLVVRNCEVKIFSDRLEDKKEELAKQ